MARVTFQGVSKNYGGGVAALEHLDLEAREGEFLTLLGPSGCGKTTALRLVSGLLRPSSGAILFDGEDVSHLPPQARSIGMVFQDYALFPHLTVYENIAFGLRERRAPKATIPGRVAELLRLVRLEETPGRYPAQLSGGQQQRIAVARAIAHTPRVLLMDEPLGALDLKLREHMQQDLRRIQQELGITTIYVTHDQFEAMTMSDRIAIMNQGKLLQVATPEEIYLKPRSRFVAGFVGRVNLLPVAVAGRNDGWFDLNYTGTRLRTPQSDTPVNGTATLAIRPEHVVVTAAESAPNGHDSLPGVLEQHTFGGNLRLVSVRVGDTAVMAELRADQPVLPPGSPVRVGWDPQRSILLED